MKGKGTKKRIVQLETEVAWLQHELAKAQAEAQAELGESTLAPAHEWWCRTLQFKALRCNCRRRSQ